MAENQGEREWIVEPPGRDEISLHIALGEGVALTAEQEEALSALLQSLETADAEVVGHAKCTKNNSCTKLECQLAECVGLRCGTLESKLVGGGGVTIMGSFGPVV